MSKKNAWDEPELPEPKPGQKHPEPKDPEPQPKAPLIVQQTQFKRQLVVDVDFTTTNTVKIAHSCHSDNLFVSIVNVSPETAWAIPPAVTFDDEDNLTLTQTTAEGRFRVYIQVVP